MKRVLMMLLAFALFLSGCENRDIKINNVNSNTNNIEWKWSFKDNHKSLENLQIFNLTDGGKSWEKVNVTSSGSYSGLPNIGNISRAL